jgi:Tfp pilus assembly protein PilW
MFGRLVRQRRGFTLIELQMSLFISIITLVTAMSLYIAYWRIFVIGNTLLDVYANSRISMALISRDIRMAAQVVASNSPYTTTDHCIVLKVPAVDSTGNVIASAYDYITYMLVGSDLYRIVQNNVLSSRSAENRAVARFCSSLNFSSGGVALSGIGNLSTINTVAVHLPLNEQTLSLSGSQTQTASITPTTLVRLRNK